MWDTPLFHFLATVAGSAVTIVVYILTSKRKDRDIRAAAREQDRLEREKDKHEQADRHTQNVAALQELKNGQVTIENLSLIHI